MPDGSTIIGTTLEERFRISRVVADTLYGDRCVARDRTTRKQVTVQFVRPDLMALHGEMFRESNTQLARVESPFVMNQLAWGEHDRQGYRITEWGKSDVLIDRLEDPILMSSAVGWSTDIARALQAASREDLVHFSLSPHHVKLFRRSDGPASAKVDGWGLSRLLEGSDAMTSTGLVDVRSAPWLAPEYLQGHRCDGRSDLYSLGALLFQLLTGHPPFTGPTMKVLAAHVGDPAQAPSRHASGIPLWLDELVLALLEKDPHNRPQTAEEVVRKLTEGAATLVDGAAQPNRVTASAAPARLPRVAIHGAGAKSTLPVVERPARVPPPPPPRFGLWVVALVLLVGLASFLATLIVLLL